MDVLPEALKAAAAAEAARTGSTLEQVLAEAAAVAAEDARIIREGLAAIDEALAELGGPDPAIVAEVDAEFAALEARAAELLTQRRGESAA